MSKRKSLAMIEQIQFLYKSGHSIRKISSILRISRNTVRCHIRDLEKESVEVKREVGKSPPIWVQKLDLNKIKLERKSGVGLKQLYEEYEIPVSYSQFGKYLRKHLGTKLPKPAPILTHRAGEKAQVDYADGLWLTERRTGNKKRVQLFCGVLPFSSLTFAEFSSSQKLHDFIRSHERMWSYFGGVTRYVVIDNLKAGVTKSHCYDPDINPTYCDYGNHSGFAVLPARPRTPRDKASVEAAIGVIQRIFYQKYRNTIFYTLEEMNHHLRSFINELNGQIMKEFGASRRERFTEEAKQLLPLPEALYEMFEIKIAKVHPDCCVQVFKALYSVHFSYIGQEVRVKISDKMVTISDNMNQVIAVHLRQPEYGRSIVEDHLPQATQQLKSFDVIKAKSIAKRIGLKTKEYVDWQFNDERPLRVLRRIQGVIRLFEKGIPSDAMEYAATQALQFQRCDLRYFTDCANFFSKTGGIPQLTQLPHRKPSTIHIRGEN